MATKEHGMAGEQFEVPIFALNVVLFPGMVLPLHVFELRYRRMIADCLADRAPFGVVLAQGEEEGTDAGVPPILARVGTLAHIADYEQLPDGRYNLLAKGTRRFEILKLHATKPYLTATVHAFQDVDTGVGTDVVVAARNALDAYLHAVMALVGSPNQHISIPDDAVDLSYLVGTCLTCEDGEKQSLLEMNSVMQRLYEGARMLRHETRQLAQQGENSGISDRSMLN
jgi:Lon protease-like protein